MTCNAVTYMFVEGDQDAKKSQKGKKGGIN